MAKRKPKPQKTVVEVDDPLFGKLVWNDEKSWFVGRLVTPLSPDSLAVYVESDKSGPAEDHRLALEELFDVVPKLQSEIALALFEVWDEISEGATKDRFNASESAAELFQMIELAGIIVSLDDRGCSLEYKFRADIWPEQSLFVSIFEGRAFAAGSAQ
jgi:hypothetical protein